jgi:hypothetical protein
MPGGDKEDDEAESKGEGSFRAVGGDVFEGDQGEDDTGDSAVQHNAEDAVVNLAMHDQEGDEDEVDDGRVSKGGADGDVNGWRWARGGREIFGAQCRGAEAAGEGLHADGG